MESSRSLTLIRSLVNEDANVSSQAAWILFFAALTALGANVQIPHQPVPFTLQTFFVLLAGAFLGGRNGLISQVLYVSVGVLGMPVFTAGGFGADRIFGPTGGYLLSFPLAAFVIGYLIRLRPGLTWTVLSMLAGLVVIFTCGTLFLWIGFLHNVREAFFGGFLIFSWWDSLKLAAAAAIYHEFAKRYKKLPAV